MKKTITILSLAFTALVANATVKTVSNNPNSPGQYTDLQVAITAAANNDTLYVHGSPNTYGNVSITKPLTIIGAGALPNKDYYYSTILVGITLSYNSLYTSSGSGSKIIGCSVSGIGLSAGDNTSAHPGISNVTITRNKVGSISFNENANGGQSALAHNNISIYNNVIGSLVGPGGGYYGSIKNSIIRNNLIYNCGNLGSINIGTILIANNIFFGSISPVNATISNNIFYTLGTSAFAGGSCSLSNNCFYSPTYTYVLSDIVGGSNNGNNNIMNQDPLFVYYDALAASVYDYTLSNPAAGPFANFNLLSGSPCLLTGSDGLNLGVYGGLSPFIEGYPADSRFRYFPMPAIPQMLQMNIQNAAILPSGTLNVNFKARKQN